MSTRGSHPILARPAFPKTLAAVRTTGRVRRMEFSRHGVEPTACASIVQECPRRTSAARHEGRTAASLREVISGRAFRLGLEKRQQVFVDLVLVGRAQAVRSALVDLEERAPDKF